MSDMIWTHEQLPMMPHYMGNLLYPSGAPIKPDSIQFDNKTMQDMLLAHDQDLKKSEIEAAKQYMIYYANAPLFRLVETHSKMMQGLSLSMSRAEILDHLMDYGLDPI